MDSNPTLLKKAGVDLRPSKLSDSILVVIDMQNEYLPNGNVPLEGVEEALEEGGKILRRARGLKVPVVHVVHHGPSGSGFYDPKGIGGQIHDTVKPQEGETVIAKNHVSAFINTNMKETLESLGKKELIVIGFMTHMCLSTFVRAAVEQYGYKCTVVANCTATRTLPLANTVVKAQDVQLANLAALNDFFAPVVNTVEEIEN